MGEFRMPSLGADMESGTLVQWLVHPGDRVSRGDVVAVVETQKGAIEVEIFDEGTVQQLIVPEGAVVPVGAVLAMVNGGNGRVSLPPPVEPAPVAAPVEPGAVRVTIPAPVPSRLDGTRIHASPLARRRAVELGIDLLAVEGSRPGGAICLHDVERAAETKVEIPSPTLPKERVAPSVAEPREAVEPAEERVAQDPRAAMRAAIAAAMAKANREIPHYYLGTDIDLKPMLDWLEETNLQRPVTERLLYAVPLIKAVALALREVPELNGFFADEMARPSDAIHIGWAISLRAGGLVAPAIHDVDLLTLDQIMEALRDLILRARSGKLRSSEMTDPTITITSLGEQGVPEVYGVIYPPQVALVGFGKIVERPWAVDGMLTVRPVIRATLAADHRASDGHRGGLFLSAVERLLKEPEKL
jgi:pyruvate dehydrogenase E2 component (dihydrolipoamide acetyltransferase)